MLSLGEYETFTTAYKKLRERELQLSVKQETTAEENIELLSEDLANVLYEVVLEVYDKYTDKDVLTLTDVEQIIQQFSSEIQDVLNVNIHDYYLAVSEQKEEETNARYGQSDLVNKYIELATSDKSMQLNLDNWTSWFKRENLIAPMRRAKNITRTLDNYFNEFKQVIGWTTETFTDEELLIYEVDEAVVEYLANNIFQATERTMERVSQDIYEIISDSYAQRGEGIDVVAEDILKQFNELADYEAKRIARTETLKARGDATYNRLINNPTVELKQWMATEDERTRDSHVELNGQITYVDGVFSNGLEYPGDESGDIEEWINCRCDLVAFYEEAGFVPPEGADYWYEDEMVLDSSITVPDFDIFVEVLEDE